MSSTDLAAYAFEPGQQVQCKTRFDDSFKGEVLAFDLNTKVLILKSPSASGNNTNHDLHFLVLDSVKDVEILEEPHGEYNNDLPSIEMKYVSAKQAETYNERMRLVEAVENGVNQDGISLFTALTKKYGRATDVTWKDKVKIVVMNSVLISPPYKETNCEPVNPKAPSKDALNYVKSVVQKFWDSNNKPKQPS